MHSFIAAMLRRFPVRLAIIAGHPAMIGTGPLGGMAVETGLVIASRDPVAADTTRKAYGRELDLEHPWRVGPRVASIRIHATSRDGAGERIPGPGGHLALAGGDHGDPAG
jgi:hypothetical protein